jgi:hypothetical protein
MNFTAKGLKTHVRKNLGDLVLRDPGKVKGWGLQTPLLWYDKELLENFQSS